MNIKIITPKCCKMSHIEIRTAKFSVGKDRHPLPSSHTPPTAPRRRSTWGFSLPYLLIVRRRCSVVSRALCSVANSARLRVVLCLIIIFIGFFFFLLVISPRTPSRSSPNLLGRWQVGWFLKSFASDPTS